MSRIYVLLFNARTENEGIHTLKTNGRDKILMFEDEDDATRFALMLEAQDLPPVTVEGMDDQDITEFCKEANYDYQLIPEGKLEIPPEAIATEMDWKPDGNYPEESEPETESEVTLESSDPELEQMRQRLEGLFSSGGDS